MGVVNMQFTALLNLVQYFLYFSCVTAGAIYLYKFLTSEHERMLHKNIAVARMNKGKLVLSKKNQNSAIQKKMKESEINSFSSLKLQFIRVIVILIITVYYVGRSMMGSEPFNTTLILLPIILYFGSEYTIRFILGVVIKHKRKKKLVELFNLFDILKTDLSAMTSSDYVNIYSILRDAEPLFEHINGTIARFLSLWKTSPQKAKDVFEKEIGGESSKVLGELLYKLDRTSRDKALDIINAESGSFSTAFYEGELQNSGKQKNFYYGFFMGTCLLIFLWLFIFIFTMMYDSMFLI